VHCKFTGCILKQHMFKQFLYGQNYFWHQIVQVQSVTSAGLVDGHECSSWQWSSLTRLRMREICVGLEAIYCWEMPKVAGGRRWNSYLHRCANLEDLSFGCVCTSVVLPLLLLLFYRLSKSLLEHAHYNRHELFTKATVNHGRPTNQVEINS